MTDTEILIERLIAKKKIADFLANVPKLIPMEDLECKRKDFELKCRIDFKSIYA